MQFTMGKEGVDGNSSKVRYSSGLWRVMRLIQLNVDKHRHFLRSLEGSNAENWTFFVVNVTDSFLETRDMTAEASSLARDTSGTYSTGIRREVPHKHSPTEFTLNTPSALLLLPVSLFRI